MQIAKYLGLHTIPCKIAWELDETARAALLCNNHSDAPEHVFGDVLSIYPAASVKKMYKIQRALVREFKEMKQAGAFSHPDGIDLKGKELLMGLDGILEGVRVATSAWCHRHHRYCVVPVPEDPDSWTFHCAGSTCVDFSLRSKSRLGFSGPHMCPFVGRAFMRRACREWLIMHKCVALHPTEWLLNHYIGDTHVVKSFLMCPSYLGHPATRLRKFTIAIHRSRVATTVPRSLPADMFRSRCVLDGSVYFSAEPFEVDCFLAAAGANTCRGLLAPGFKRRFSMPSCE